MKLEHLVLALGMSGCGADQTMIGREISDVFSLNFEQGDYRTNCGNLRKGYDFYDAATYCPNGIPDTTVVEKPKYDSNANEIDRSQAKEAVTKILQCVYEPLKTVLLTTEKSRIKSNEVYIGGRGRGNIAGLTEDITTPDNPTPRLDVQNTFHTQRLFAGEDYTQLVAKHIAHEIGHALG